ncbi:hypothetical protein [Streptomyces sp. NPDC005303]|uniref:hypothetical protein n=1 Tax=Streptomyces sp. NPDC005303 TaxID=3155713 RepID=UPI0033B26F6B
MNDSDIALLLADAADEVEIGIAPYQAVLRGGRRRRARRWAVAAATALVLAGSSATLAVAGLPGGDGGGGAVATQPPATGTPRAFEPANRTTLATGTENGKQWRVTLDSWQAPVDTAEARATMNAMRAHGEYPPDVRGASDLVGKIAYFVHLDYGGESKKVMENTVSESDSLTGTDLMSGSLPLEPGNTKDVRLVIGYVAKTAQRVNCVWTNETATVVEKAGSATGTDVPAIRSPQGSPYNWFVCLAPKGAEYKTAEVIE